MSEILLGTDRASAALFTLGQFWNPVPEPELRPTKTLVWWRDNSLFVEAELTDDDVFNTATAHNQRTWETGDVFEIFARREDSTEYVEVHVTPGNIKLHLKFLDFDQTNRIESIDEVAADPGEIESSAEITPTGWKASARVPLPASPGELVRVSLCRYDASRGSEKLVLSSTSPHTELRFHQPCEWPLCRLALTLQPPLSQEPTASAREGEV